MLFHSNIQITSLKKVKLTTNSLAIIVHQKVASVTYSTTKTNCASYT